MGAMTTLGGPIRLEVVVHRQLVAPLEPPEQSEHDTDVQLGVALLDPHQDLHLRHLR